MVVKRVHPMSIAKMSAVLYVLIGLFAGICISLVSMMGLMAGNDAGAMGALFGVAAVIALPLIYGAMGFVGSLIAALLYNLVAGWVGGVEIDVA